MGVTESKTWGCPVRNSSAKEGCAPRRVAASEKKIRDPANTAAVGRPQPQPVPKRSTSQFEAEARRRPGAAPLAPDAAAPDAPAAARRPLSGVQEPPRLDPNEPEWAQFLAKKVAEKHAKPVPTPDSNLKPTAAPAPTAGAAPAATQGAPLTVNTSEYLKLLKAGEQRPGPMALEKRQRNQWNAPKPLSPGVGPPPGLAGGTGAGVRTMASLKSDLTGALDSIIRSERHSAESNFSKGKKALAPGATSKEEALRRIAQLLESGSSAAGVGDEEPDDAQPVIAVARDDLQLERQNRDEYLAELAYWSEDDKAPRAIQRPSAHKVGTRPLKDRSVRGYVTQELGSELDKQVSILMTHLARLNDRHRTFDPMSPGKHRFVVGIKEVNRAVRQGRVKCVIAAPDIEEASTGGGYDDRMREILRATYEQDVPVVFALSRVRLGRAFGKYLRMSVVAILDVTGVQAHYDEMLSHAFEKRVEWHSKLQVENQKLGKAGAGAGEPESDGWTMAKGKAKGNAKANSNSKHVNSRRGEDGYKATSNSQYHGAEKGRSHNHSNASGAHSRRAAA